MLRLVNNYAAYINAQVEVLKNKPKEQRLPVSPFITISRQTGAYGLTISKGLCDYLKAKDKNPQHPWTVFNKEIIKKITEHEALTETVLPYLPASAIVQTQEIMQSTYGFHANQDAMVLSDNKTILQLAQLGYAIFLGMGSNIITSKLSGGFHIRLISPFEDRVEHIGEYYPMSEKEAKEYIYTEEGNRHNYVRKYFEKDIDDPMLYDMVINVDKIQPESVIQIIGDLILKRCG